MKTSGKLTYELEGDDLVNITLWSLKKNKDGLGQVIINWFKENKGVTPSKVLFVNNDIERIQVLVEQDDGVVPFHIDKPQIEKTPSTGHSRRWTDLYYYIGEIIDEQRGRKKNFISWEDLRAELLELEDEKGHKRFIKDGVELPMADLKQRMAPSQVKRQALTQANFRGIKPDKKRGGLII